MATTPNYKNREIKMETFQRLRHLDRPNMKKTLYRKTNGHFGTIQIRK